MTATKKKKYNNVGLSPAIDRDLKKVCAVRGWTKTEAVRRMTLRELETIQREGSSEVTLDHP